LKDQGVPEKNLDHILYKIHFDINTKAANKKGKVLSRVLNWSARIAAVIILPLAIFWGVKGYLETNTSNETWIEVKAPAWTRVKFSLPDGTIGWLNSNSSVRYNRDFMKDRQVVLTGEAFFDVLKDYRRPFIVQTKEVNVKVVGTRFNIASYDNENNVEVVLEEGKLLFSDKKTNKSYFMSPNDLVIFDKISNEFSTEKVETAKYSSWTQGMLVFRNDPLDVIARRLERWYNIDVELRGAADRDPRLRATFVDESLEEVLHLLKRSLLIDYSIQNRSLNPDDTIPKKKVIITVKPLLP
jgi:ferric-dicitrate binding protein FerR (iron transport regulator)